MSLRKGDRSIFILLACLIAAAFIARGITGKHNGQTVEVYLGSGSTPYRTVSLEEDSVIEIRQENGAYNRVEVKNGTVYMACASCKNQICVNTAPLSKDSADSEWIVCLPNGVSVQVTGGE